MENGKFVNFLLIWVVFLILLGSTFCYFYSCSLDGNVLRAEPYLEKIVLNDSSLKNLAESYVVGCSVNDKSCEVNKIYRNVVERNKYLSDPKETELIRSPSNTLANKGGDCEDLAILASSLLENIGVKTYLVLTPNHAYALACGVDINKITNYGQESLKEVYAQKMENETNLEVYVKDGQIFVSNSFNETMDLDSGYVLFRSLGGDFSALDISYKLSSSKEFQFFVVPSVEEFRKFGDRKNFEYYKNCDLKAGVCRNVPGSAGVLLFNPNSYNIKINGQIKFIYPYDSSDLFVNQSLSFYQIKNETCVVLETTAGEFGFVGLASKELTGDKFAFDTRTKEYFKLG